MFCQATKGRIGSTVNCYYKEKRDEKMPLPTETFEYLFDNCLEFPIESRLRIMAHVCHPVDTQIENCKKAVVYMEGKL